MLFEFLYELRRRKVPVGTHEAVALAGALKAGLHDSSLDGFYYVARSLLVHSEAHLDAFDQAFAAHFKGVEDKGTALADEVLQWLQGAKERVKDLTPEERALLETMDLEGLRKLFEERLREQRERHDRGNKWVGTGGTSPFGHSGAAREGIRVGGPGGNRSAVQVAESRNYRGYRDDLTLDVRQTAVALRKLRAFAREGSFDELDVEETIQRTADNAGELEIVTRPPRRPTTRVILMMDVGGSMDPYIEQVSRLFSAASKATHFKELRTYYFHNCIYGRVYKSPRFDEALPVRDLIAECNEQYKLILVGDASMAPYELMERGGALGYWDPDGEEGIVWLMRLAEHFKKSAWLNPEPRSAYGTGTIAAIARVFPMYPLTLEGLGEAIAHLTKGAMARGPRRIR